MGVELDRKSYSAGYNAGYAGKPMESGKWNKLDFNKGYKDGKKSKDQGSMFNNGAAKAANEIANKLQAQS